MFSEIHDHCVVSEIKCFCAIIYPPYDPSAEVNVRVLPVLMVEVHFDVCPYLFQITTFPVLKRVRRDTFLSNAENNSIRGKIFMTQV